ncbi:hypothetical protein ACQP1K_15870 [Sphaerimonospora sp. CA-214678]|uniref:hypothetical protein n=1 Tax=Sphaerimonospora sp. CA-214678 TaxID=3240029 RepID=UPI003D93CE6D
MSRRSSAARRTVTTGPRPAGRDRRPSEGIAELTGRPVATVAGGRMWFRGGGPAGRHGPGARSVRPKHQTY